MADTDLAWVWPFIADRSDSELAELVEAINATVRQRALKDENAKIDVTTKEGFYLFVAQVAKQTTPTLEATVAEMQKNIFAVSHYTLKMKVIRGELRARNYHPVSRIPFERKTWKDRLLDDDGDTVT